jgi:hypothetical protein
MANNPKPEYIYIDGTPININNPKNKKLLKEFKRDADRITRKEDGGEIVPKKYKGFSKLPEAVQKKIDPDLANKYVKGGRVKPKPMKARAKPAQAKPTMTKPRPINLGTTPKPTTFTGKINTETQKLQNIDGKTVVVDKSNKPSTMARSRLKPVKLPLRMETGGETPILYRKDVIGKPMRQGTTQRKITFREKGGPKGFLSKTKETTTAYADKSTGGIFKDIKDKPRNVKRAKKMARGGLVKGGTSSQMTGKEYKGIF